MSMMVINALNVGLPAKETFNGKEITTGICKKPVRTAHLGTTGFERDGVGDRQHHGGPDKAVCAYGTDYYPYWTQILKTALPPAPFGENLSVSNLDETSQCIGDIFQIGTAVVQISQPRQPCVRLAMRLGRSDMVKLIVDSGRTGYYFRTLQEGIVEVGHTLILKERDRHGVTVSFANWIYHHNRTNQEGIERVLAVEALSDSWRNSFLKLREAL